MSTDGWIKLSKIDAAFITDPVKISPSKFMILDQSNKRVMIYDSRNDKWQCFTQQDTMTVRSIVFDVKHHKYYALDGFCQNILIFDADDVGQCEKVPVKNGSDVSGFGCAICFANGKFHVIGGYASKSHMTFDPKTREFKTIHIFNEWTQRNLDFGLLYVASKIIYYYLLVLINMDGIRKYGNVI